MYGNTLKRRGFVFFLVYEIIVGMYLPFDGVIRTIYIPNKSICSVHTMLRVIVNIAVATEVMSTNYITHTITHRIVKKKEYNSVLNLERSY